MSKLQQLEFSHSGSINNPINRVLSCKKFANNNFDIFWKFLSSFPLMVPLKGLPLMGPINGSQWYGLHYYGIEIGSIFNLLKVDFSTLLAAKFMLIFSTQSKLQD